MTRLDDGSSHRDLSENLVIEKQAKVTDHYKIIKIIGEGSISSISKVKKYRNASLSAKTKKIFWCIPVKSGMNSSMIEDGEIYALKTIDKRMVNDEFLDELMNELKVLRSLDHPNIMKAYEVFEWKNELGIILELCSGGDLYQRSPYSEKEAANIMQQLLTAMAYMHEKPVMHRDIKYENIMFESNDEHAAVKFIDFGLSKKFLKKDHDLTDRVGTIYTMAPQVLKGSYDLKADIWSLGVVAYMMLTSTKPFWGNSRRQIILKIRDNDPPYRGSIWNNTTPESKKFVKALLTTDPSKRLSAREALQHPWLKKQHFTDKTVNIEEKDAILLKMVDYSETNELKKLALTVIARKASPAEITKLRDAFNEYDTNKNGYITKNEFSEAFSNLGYSKEDVDNIFKQVDFTCDTKGSLVMDPTHDAALGTTGVINYTEFLAATIESYVKVDRKKLADAFDSLDSDDTGYISKKNLRTLLGKQYSDEAANKIIDAADVNKDGQISFQEFMTAFMKKKNDEMSEHCL